MLIASLFLLLLPSWSRAQERVTIQPKSGQSQPVLHFTRVTQQAGLSSSHGYCFTMDDPMKAVSGVAVGDVNGDGWGDLYTLRGTEGADYLFINQRAGTFKNKAAAYGVEVSGERGSGPSSLADYDRDRDLDIFFTHWIGIKKTAPDEVHL